jgi:hypothetical protein
MLQEGEGSLSLKFVIFIFLANQLDAFLVRSPFPKKPHGSIAGGQDASWASERIELGAGEEQYDSVGWGQSFLHDAKKV